jgi:hypothetical protein
MRIKEIPNKTLNKALNPVRKFIKRLKTELSSADQVPQVDDLRF